MIENFQRWKANLSSWVDWFIDKNYKDLNTNYSYKDSKRKIENLEVLKILDNREDIRLRQKNDSILCVTNDYFYSYSAFSLF